MFRGQQNQIGRFTVDPGLVDDREISMMDSLGYKNAEFDPMLTSAVLRQNLWDVQDRQRLPHSEDFVSGVNLTIEMETGTGKTYTYIKTMYELNKSYGWSKFIIVVPSIAIREGVYKTFQTTQEHFTALYGKAVRFFIYNSKNLAELDRFANDASINAMIINAQAFNARGKDANRIRRKLDEFKSRRPIDVIAATHPILIIDEPQSVEGPKTSIQSAVFMTSRLCSITMTEFPLSTSLCSTSMSLCTSAVCNPVVGSSRIYRVFPVCILESSKASFTL